MVEDPSSMSIVSAVISLAHSLHLTVVAEGVETIEQARLLREMGCDQMQGFLFSEPRPAAEIESFLSRPQAFVLA